MRTTTLTTTSAPPGKLFRYSSWDALMVLCVLLHGGLLLLLAWMSASLSPLLSSLVIAVGICWSSNTTSHNHLHNPFFSARWLNQAFSLYLTMLLGIPQTIWKEKHLWHHAGEPADARRRGLSRQKWLELLSVGLVWCCLWWWRPDFFVWAYLPGFAVGLAFCQLQGHYEHMGESGEVVGISHYGRWYNWLWFNDGFHAEHHRHPRMHWRALPAHRIPEVEVKSSAWSPHFRWLWMLNRVQGALLGWLERGAIASGWLQHLMLTSHRRAFCKTLKHLPEATLQHVAIVGGGLFPRTLLILQELLPGARFTIIEQEQPHIAQAQKILQARGHAMTRVTFVQASFTGVVADDVDALVIPMAFIGERERLYDAPSAPIVWVHDWIWRRRGQGGAVIAWWLCKRLNVIQAAEQRTTGVASSHIVEDVEPQGSDR